MPMGAQPADEFERGWREALEGFVNEGERLPVFRQHLFLGLQSFLFPLGFGGVGHSLLLV